MRYDFLPGIGWDAREVWGRFVTTGGGFRVVDTPRGCRITHVETYDFGEGRLGRLLERVFRGYVAWSMRGELDRLARLAEKVAIFTRTAAVR